MPQEFIDAVLMAEYHWSFEQLQATPPYVVRFCWDFLQTKWAHEQGEIDRSRREAEAARTRG